MRFAARFVLLLAVLAWLEAPAAAADPPIDGMYLLTGVNPDGSEYEGLVKIIPRGQSFLVSWIFPRVSGETIVAVIRSAGVGIAKDGSLAVSYYGQDATGVVLYHIEEGGQRLTGHWVSAADDGGTVHSETLTKLPAAPPPVSRPPSESPKRARPSRPIPRSTQALVSR